MSSKKYIVTGLSGLLGSHFKARCEGSCDLIPLDLGSGVDVTNSAQVEALLGKHADANAVLHLAAFTDVSAASAERGDKDSLCYQLNVTGSENVARSAERHGLHLVHVSTDFVFDGAKEEGEYFEDDLPHPIEWYGETKFLAEEKVRGSGVSATIMRTAFPYFCGEGVRKDMVGNMREKLASGEKLKLFDDQVITPTFGGDIVAALHLLAETCPAGEIFHVMGATSLSPYQFGLAVAEVFDLDSKQLEASSMVDYLKIDARPRQRFLRISNKKYSDFAEENGVRRPLGVKDGLLEVLHSLAG